MKTQLTSAAKREHLRSSSNNGKFKKSDITCQSSDYNYFGKALKELRLQKELSQEAAAQKMHIKQATWSAYELGKIDPDLKTIVKIAEVLEVRPLTLLAKSLDKSRHFNDSSYELSFDDYEKISEGIEIKLKKLSKLKSKELEFV